MRATTKRRPIIAKLKKKGDVPKGTVTPADLNAGNVFPNHMIRTQMKLPSSRMFDDFQLMSYTDVLLQNTTVDKITNFALELPVDWYRTVRSSETENFLYHVLLSMGYFTTELELIAQGSLQQSFIHARIFTDSTSEEEKKKSAHKLITSYFEQQLSHHPMGTCSFDNEIVTAIHAIENFLLRDSIVSRSMPSALFSTSAIA
mmetsp:Transcript_22289/g.62749  ORF Transcript_22289/g.62749 Transcript_22289/m.62749 type:complete len:202 (-) Transcript_22289:17-622(-)